ncbi:MAG: hypothetical protein MZV63_58000, partial [Marinilabiliales bacterium]|nr:hypothetical protein [Marinilabiliales bacterium]
MMAKLRKFGSWTLIEHTSSYPGGLGINISYQDVSDLEKSTWVWESSQKCRADGLFWQTDVTDGMEEE